MAWRSFALALPIVLSLGAIAAARPWRWQRRLGRGDVTTIAAGADGTVYACGELENGRSGVKHLPDDAVQIDARSGRIAWRGKDWGTCADVALTIDGDPLVAGEAFLPGASGSTFGVVRRSARTGAIVWRFDIDGSDRTPYSPHGEPISADGAATVKQSPDGDVVAGGRIDDAVTRMDPCVVRLDGATGRERWRRCWDGSLGSYDQPALVHVLPSGDVVASMELAESPYARVHVVRLAAADGAERWRTTLPDAPSGRGTTGGRLAPTRDGRVLVTASQEIGSRRRRSIVVELDPTSGAIEWQWTGAENVGIRDLAITANGDVVAAGWARHADSPNADDLLVVRLHGASGAQRWAQRVRDHSLTEGAYAIALTSLGEVWVTGAVTPSRRGQLIVLGLDAETGATLREVRLPGYSRGRTIVFSDGLVLVGGEAHGGRAFMGGVR